MKAALVVGSEGQDGRLISRRLLDDGARVVGVTRTGVTDSRGRDSGPVDLERPEAVRELIGRVSPDEIYYLAAVHGSAQSMRNDDPALLRAMTGVHVLGFANFLEATRHESPNTSIVAASSSRIFGVPPRETQDESTPVAPICLYGITKAAALQLGRYYRESFGLRVSSAILYNHESPHRAPGFVSQKIIRGARAIVHGEASEIVLGDLGAEVDWGWAPDYVEAMLGMARQSGGEDYVVATGEAHSVREFVQLVFELAGIGEFDPYVRVDPSLIGRHRARMIGDASKLSAATGWRPRTTFPEMVERLWLAAI